MWCAGGVDGRKLVVKGEPEHRELILALTEGAYKAGARLVDVLYQDPLVIRARLEHGGDHAVDAFPDYLSRRYAEYAGDEYTYVAFTGSGHPDALAGSRPDRVGRYAGAMRTLSLELARAQAEFRKAWVGGIGPTAALASRAFPDLRPEEALPLYEEAVVRVLHLDDADPAAYWQAGFADLARRRHRFTMLNIDTLRFTGPGTDLTVGLHSGTRWQTAEETLADGRCVRVNVPSCEVFTTPDCRRTTGRVTATRPYVSTSVPGAAIAGVRLEFDEGRVVSFGADEGADVLERILNMDAGAALLGEVALVDETSPVAAEGTTFHNVLFDENAACHIALGFAFPRLVTGTEGRSPEELRAMGVNQSLVHDDIMIGSSDVDVTATTFDGRQVPIMQQGRFVL